MSLSFEGKELSSVHVTGEGEIKVKQVLPGENQEHLSNILQNLLTRETTGRKQKKKPSEKTV